MKNKQTSKIVYEEVGNAIYVSQTDLAILSGRSRHWLCNITRLGLLNNTWKKPGTKTRYYPLEESLAVLKNLPLHVGRKNDKRRVKK